MAIVKGRLQSGKLESPVDQVIGIKEWNYSYNRYNKEQQPNAVVLGGINPKGYPKYPMIPGAINVLQLRAIPLESYKYPSKPKRFPEFLPPPNVFSRSVGDSVTPSDSLAFDQGHQIDDTLSLADNATPSLSVFPQHPSVPGGSSFVFTINKYESPSVIGPYTVILGGFAGPVNWQRNIDDTLGLSDNANAFKPGQLPPVYLRPNPPYDRPQLTGPFGRILGGTKTSPINNTFWSISDSLTLDDIAYLDRSVSSDDDIVVITDFNSLGPRTQDSVAISDQINFSFVTGTANFTPSQSDSVGVLDEIQIFMGRVDIATAKSNNPVYMQRNY